MTTTTETKPTSKTSPFPPKGKGRSVTPTPVVTQRSSTHKSAVQRQRETLSDWNHAS